jgi:hypothetical protein
MSKSKHSEAQIVAALMRMDAGRKAEDVAREVGVSKHPLDSSDFRRLKHNSSLWPHGSAC